MTWVIRVAVIVLALVMSAAMLTPTLTKFISMRMFGSDYFVIAKAMGQLAEFSYLPTNPPYAYPPTTRFFLWPLGYFQTFAGYVVFTAATAGAFLYFCSKHLGRTELALILFSFPFVNTALIGQTTFLVVALMLLGLSLKDRMWAGIVFGIAFAIKFQLVLLIPLYLLIHRDWKAIGYAAITLAAVAMGSISFFGEEAFDAWPGAVANYSDVILNGEVIRWVITPIGMAIREGLPVWPIAVPCILGAMALPFLKYADPVEALFGLTLASLLVLPFGCPDNALGLVPLLVRRIAKGSIPETIPYSLYFPGFVILAAFYSLICRSGWTPTYRSWFARQPLVGGAS